MNTEAKTTTRVLTQAQRDAKNAQARAKRAAAGVKVTNPKPVNYTPAAHAPLISGDALDAAAELRKMTPAERVAKIQRDAELEHAAKQANKKPVVVPSITSLATARQTVPQTTTSKDKVAAKAERLAEQDKVLAAHGKAPAVKAAPAPKATAAAAAPKTAPEGTRQIALNKAGTRVVNTRLSEAMARQFIDPAIQAELRKQGTTNYRVWLLFKNSKSGEVTREDICLATGLGNWNVSMVLKELNTKYGFKYTAAKESITGLNAKTFEVPQFVGVKAPPTPAAKKATELKAKAAVAKANVVKDAKKAAKPVAKAVKQQRVEEVMESAR